MSTSRSTAAFAVMAMVGVAWAADVSVGWRQSKDLYTEASEAQTDKITVGDGGGFYKTGEGTLEVPFDAVSVAGKGVVKALDGTLKLTSSATAAIQPPAVIAEKAAFWTDATAGNGLVTTGGGEEAEYAARWCDRRETNFETPTMWYAQPAWTNHPSSSLWGVNPLVRTVDGRRAVDFGGYHSSQCMVFMKNGTKASIKKIRDFFIVMGINNCYGLALGSAANNAYCPMFFDNTYTWSTASRYMWYEGTYSRQSFSSRYYLDGEQFDPYTTKPKRGFSVLEGHAIANYVSSGAEADAFFQSYPGGKQNDGGDYLCEVIVFTDFLSEEERTSVERYLMAKWNLPAGTKIVRDLKGKPLAAGTGAMLELSVAAGREDAVSLAGDGSVVKTGAGSILMGPTDDRPFNGTLDIEEGSVRLKGGRVPAMALAGGQRLNSSETYAVADDESSAATTLTVHDDAAATEVEKDGEGPARLSVVKDGVQKLIVKAGLLTLGGETVKKPAVAAGSISVPIKNADFEMNFVQGNVNPQNPYYVNFGQVATADYGWYQLVPDCSTWLMTVDNPNVTMPGGPVTQWGTWCPKACPQGTNVLYMVGKAGTYTKVTFPRKGRYVLSFLACARNQNGPVPQHDLMIGETTDSLVRFGTHLGSVSEFARYHYRMPEVEANKEYVVAFKARNNGDVGIAIDDVRIDYLEENRLAAAYEIPNGDLDDVVDGFLPASPKSASTNQTKGWTLDATVNTANYPLAMLTTPATTIGVETPYFSIQDMMWGSVQLMLSSATWAQTAFTPPAGTYKLRCKAACWPNEIYNGAISGHLNAKIALLQATATIGGVAKDLGTLSVTRHPLEDYVWTEPFTVDGTQEVTLKVAQTDAKAIALLDDFDLVAADAASDGECLADAEMPETSTSATAWTPYALGDGWAWFNDFTDDRFGLNHFTAGAFMYVGGNKGMKQTMTFPASGTYRLKMQVRGAFLYPVGCDALSAWICRTGTTATNVILHTTPYASRNFVEHVCHFKVDVPGEYEFGIGGTLQKTSVIGACSVKRIADELAETPTVPGDLRINVKEGAMLVLDFPGTLKTGGVRLGGQYVTGTINAKTHPQYITGMGSIEATTQTGMVIILK